jgi:Siphovirus Gp157
VRLYELAAEYERLLELAEECEPGDAALTAALGDVEAALEHKCAGIGRVLAQLDADAGACATEAERLRDKAQRLAANADNLRAYVLHSMTSRGIERVEGGTFSFRVALNPERVEVDSIDLVPPEYKNTKTTVTVAVDKRAVLKAYDGGRGECIAGTRVERGQRLVIK